jgi:hypothetical protein
VVHSSPNSFHFLTSLSTPVQLDTRGFNITTEANAEVSPIYDVPAASSDFSEVWVYGGGPTRRECNHPLAAVLLGSNGTPTMMVSAQAAVGSRVTV